VERAISIEDLMLSKRDSHLQSQDDTNNNITVSDSSLNYSAPEPMTIRRRVGSCESMHLAGHRNHRLDSGRGVVDA
jgi:hypothetical protein